MVIVESKKLIFRKTEIWFSKRPFDVKKTDFVYFHACYLKVNMPGFLVKEAPTLIIDLEKSLDEIWSGFGKKSCRYFIKRAYREDISVKEEKDLRKFLVHANRFAKEKGFKLSYQDPSQLPKENVVIFSAFQKDYNLASSLFIFNENHIRWLIGYSKRLEVNKKQSVVISCANRLIIWEAIKWAKDKGIKIFDFGGYSATQNKNNSRYSIDQFKKHFGGTFVVYYNYQKYYSILYKFLKKLINFFKNV